MIRYVETQIGQRYVGGGVIAFSTIALLLSILYAIIDSKLDTYRYLHNSKYK